MALEDGHYQHACQDASRFDFMVCGASGLLVDAFAALGRQVCNVARSVTPAHESVSRLHATAFAELVGLARRRAFTANLRPLRPRLGAKDVVSRTGAVYGGFPRLPDSRSLCAQVRGVAFQAHEADRPSGATCRGGAVAGAILGGAYLLLGPAFWRQIAWVVRELGRLSVRRLCSLRLALVGSTLLALMKKSTSVPTPTIPRLCATSLLTQLLRDHVQAGGIDPRGNARRAELIARGVPLAAACSKKRLPIRGNARGVMRFVQRHCSKQKLTLRQRNDERRRHVRNFWALPADERMLLK